MISRILDVKRDNIFLARKSDYSIGVDRRFTDSRSFYD